jgi:hypothetical protein
MTAAGIAIGAGLAAGIASRWLDIAAWAPAWTGNILSPWLVAAWLSGATSSVPGTGALRGLALLSGVAAGYLLTAGTDASRLAPPLVLLALAAGPAMGSAGAAWRGRDRWAAAAAAALGAVLVGEGIVAQLGPRTGPERVGFGVEVAIGLALAGSLGRRRGALLAVPLGVAWATLQVAGARVLGLALG